MRAAAAALAVMAGALVVGASSIGAASTTTSLRVAYWEDGTGEPDAVWTLQCNPARGSLARPGRACTRLAAGGSKLFAPIPPSTVCTEIYGGPQRARVTGLLAGKRIWASFTRTDGCHIARWNRLAPWLLPPGGVT
jgi:hypothetical protein